MPRINELPVDVVADPADLLPIFDAATGKTKRVTIATLLAGIATIDYVDTQLLNGVYQAPAFSGFSISGQAAAVEVGTTISGDKTFNWACSSPDNVVPGSVTISDGATVLLSGQDATGSAVITLPSGIQLTAAAPHTWTITGQDTHGHTFTRTFTVNWYWRIYYGTSASTILDELEIEALTGNVLAGSGLTTYVLGAGDFKFICYPSVMAAAALFKDTQTGFDVTMADSTDDAAYDNLANGLAYDLVSVTNSLGQTVTYRVYRSKFELGAAINIQVT